MIDLNTVTPEVRGILNNAAEWRLIAMLLERPRLHTLPQIGCIAKEILAADLKEIVVLAMNATEECYLQYFGPGGLLSPREVAYIGWGDPGKMMSEIGLLYESFSFAPRSEDPSDHIAVEANFISYLYIKEAYALLNQEDENAETAKAVRKKFIEEHFGILLYGLARKLNGSEPVYISKTLTAASTRIEPYAVQPVPSVELPAEWTGCN
jgi:hypothetical protein